MAARLHGDETDDTRTHAPLDTVIPISGSGLNTNVRDPILVLSRTEVVFALGKFVVVHNIQTQELVLVGGQQPDVVTGSQRSTGSWELGEITAMALCSKRHYLSICRAATRATSGRATVSIYSLRGTSSGVTSVSTRNHRQLGSRQRTLQYDGSNERFCCTTLSTDGKLVCCQCANTSWTIVVWDWSRERQIAVSDVHCKVSRVRFNVIDMAQISTSGGNQLKLWSLGDYSLKGFASFKSGDELRARHRVASYVDHVWLPDDCLVALLDDGNVQLIINGELIQTVQALPDGTRGYCIVAQNNGEAGILVSGSRGSMASLRVVTKLMKNGEKELHLQRRMTVSKVESVSAMGVDSAGSVLICCTEKFYGSYDLSNLCLLLADDEQLMLTPLASTPFLTYLQSSSLVFASRRPFFGGIAKTPDGLDAVLLWNQLDASECLIAHDFESHSSPTSITIHPSGSELTVSFHHKVVVFFILQDSLKVAFELPLKLVSQVAYSPSGGNLIVARSAARSLLVYRNFGFAQREPELIGVYEGVDESIERVVWAVSDGSFFYCDEADGGVMYRHCWLMCHDCVELEDAVSLHSESTRSSSGFTCVGLTCARVQRDNHEFVTFAVEKKRQDFASDAGEKLSTLRAWVSGDLKRDALVVHASTPYHLPHDVTAISPGPSKTLLLGTTHGLVVLLYWKLSRLNSHGTRDVVVMGSLNIVNLHDAPVVGLAYSRSSRALLTGDSRGTVLESRIQRAPLESDKNQQRRQLLGEVAMTEDEFVSFDPSQTFTSVCQPDEVGSYDRNTIELRRLKLLDVENEHQQLKLENELLSKQLTEQKERLTDDLKVQVERQHADTERRQRAMKAEWETQLQSSKQENEGAMKTIREDAQLARDQYLASTEKLQAECEKVKQALARANDTIEDLKLSAEERETSLRRDFEAQLRDVQSSRQQERQTLETELMTLKQQLREALAQEDEDKFTQLTLLSTTVDGEKARAAEQLSQIQGKMAALHQEVKMLLAALTQKDHELQILRDRRERDESDIEALKEQIRRERDLIQQLTKDKHDLLTAASEQRAIRDNLERLNNVHRSQIEMLQKNLIPKQQELDKMQQHLSQLHQVNQEIVIQANVSDRLRRESGARAKQNEADVVATKDLLEHVRHSIVVLQDELGELVKQSAVQDKSAIVGEVMRIHKRIARQMESLQARDGRAEEVSAELHRQNRFLMKNKQHLRRQMDVTYKEKHKLVSALSFQNSALMKELNDMRKQNKELERAVKLKDAMLQRHVAEVQLTGTGPNSTTDELDGRSVPVAVTSATLPPRPSSASSASRSSIIIPHRTTAVTPPARPKSAIARPNHR